MKESKFILCGLIFSASLFSYGAEEFVGTYHGNEWGFFSWGPSCSVDVSEMPFRESPESRAYIIRFPHIKGLEVRLNSDDVDSLAHESVTATVPINKHGLPIKGGSLKIKHGNLSQVYLWDNFLKGRAARFTCGNLIKR